LLREPGSAVSASPISQVGPDKWNVGLSNPDKVEGDVDRSASSVASANANVTVDPDNMTFEVYSSGRPTTCSVTIVPTAGNFCVVPHPDTAVTGAEPTARDVRSNGNPDNGPTKVIQLPMLLHMQPER
jgi:hypothetical protein